MVVRSESYHVPVMLKESIDGLNIHDGGVYVDVTFGGGGHSREIIRRVDEGNMTDVHLYGFDQDEDTEKNIIDDNRFTFVRSNFRYLKNWMRYYDVDGLDGVIADLGVSSHHLDDESRGFSFRFDAPLDMRMNRRATMTAADVVNEYSEDGLTDVLRLYGEVKDARHYARKIVNSRNSSGDNAIRNTGDLIEVIWGTRELSSPMKKEAARVFQALRIEVNKEMEVLKEMLESATELLKPEGRLVVITYHSLEDRLVKNVIKSGNIAGKAEQDFFGKKTTPFKEVGKMRTASDDEVLTNPRSRSAKLRIAEKKPHNA